MVGRKAKIHCENVARVRIDTEDSIEESYTIEGEHADDSKMDDLNASMVSIGSLSKLTSGLSLNEKFEKDGNDYLHEKVMTATNRECWSNIASKLTPLLGNFGQKIIQDSLDMLSISSSRESSAFQRSPKISK